MCAFTPPPWFLLDGDMAMDEVYLKFVGHVSGWVAGSQFYLKFIALDDTSFCPKYRFEASDFYRAPMHRCDAFLFYFNINNIIINFFQRNYYYSNFL